MRARASPTFSRRVLEALSGFERAKHAFPGAKTQRFPGKELRAAALSHVDPVRGSD
jgi:hypothetical protein